jgi:hypothetical protein
MYGRGQSQSWLARGGIILLTYGIWYEWHHVNRFCSRQSLRLVRADSFLRMAIEYGFSRAHVPKFKILITFYQVVAVLPDLYQLDMPQEYCKPLSPAPTPQPVCAHTLSNAFIQTDGLAGSRR